jgi:hypothetical protein
MGDITELFAYGKLDRDVLLVVAQESTVDDEQGVHGRTLVEVLSEWYGYDIGAGRVGDSVRELQSDSLVSTSAEFVCITEDGLQSLEERRELIDSCLT